MKIVSIIGKSGSGKTTLIERLIPELAKMHYKVATVKHDAHNFEVDKVGKDSWRHKNAGAKTTVVTSATKIAIFTDVEEDSSLENICEKYINGVDIILTEGFRMSKYPKIEVVRSTNDTLLCCGQSDNLIAIVCDCGFDNGVPVFKHVDIVKIADMIHRLVSETLS